MLGHQLSETAIELSREEVAVVKTLVYFDVFKYPLKPSEIHQFATGSIARQNVVPTLNYLETLGLIHKLGGYYGLADDQTLVQKREKGNVAAARMMKKARWFSQLISRFPFVRSVCISGSLSKGYIDELGDVDYFIITKPGRLWIARTMLIGFKKLFLLNSKKYFCVNYFVDTDHLEIPDKNVFTATEVRTLLPTYDSGFYADFMEANNWTSEYLPNYQNDFEVDERSRFPRITKGVLEALFSGGFGDWLDTLFMNLTVKRWERKFGHFSRADFEHALRSRKYVSKHHPQNFQKIVLNAFDEKVQAFEARHRCRLVG